MCCCGKQTINGQPGYSWDGKSRSTREVDPPGVLANDEVLFDEPGRCGGVDAHCYHFTVVSHFSQRVLLVKHGAETERIPLQWYVGKIETLLGSLDSNARFWLLLCIASAARNASDEAGKSVRNEWAKAFVDKRIKKRKRKGRVDVWIEPATANAE